VEGVAIHVVTDERHTATAVEMMEDASAGAHDADESLISACPAQIPAFS
jgi:hypothetical protein